MLRTAACEVVSWNGRKLLPGEHTPCSAACGMLCCVPAPQHPAYPLASWPCSELHILDSSLVLYHFMLTEEAAPPPAAALPAPTAAVPAVAAAVPAAVPAAPGQALPAAAEGAAGGPGAAPAEPPPAALPAEPLPQGLAGAVQPLPQDILPPMALFPEEEFGGGWGGPTGLQLG